MKNYFRIGKLVATYGVKGEIILQHSLGKKTSLRSLDAVFVEEKKMLFFLILLNLSK